MENFSSKQTNQKTKGENIEYRREYEFEDVLLGDVVDDDDAVAIHQQEVVFRQS